MEYTYGTYHLPFESKNMTMIAALKSSVVYVWNFTQRSCKNKFIA